jgi:putative hydrolase of the HAD superfamily
MSALPRAILFDMDDTILADSFNTDVCLRTVCDRFATQLGVTAAELRGALEAASDWYWGDRERHRTGRLDLDRARVDVARLALERLAIRDEARGQELSRDLADLRDEMIRPFPGAIETLRRLRELGVALALVTNGHSQRQRAKIERFNLAPFFDCIVIESEFGVGKPDARVFEHVLAQLGVRAQDAWMVGDNLEWDVAGPMSVGITGIWVDTPGCGLPESATIRPDRIIRALPELL